jgi:hypothetical protein
MQAPRISVSFPKVGPFSEVSVFSVEVGLF